MSIEGQGHFLTLAESRVHTKIRTKFSQKLLCHSEPNFVWKLSGTRKWKFVNKILVTWQGWPPCPYIVKKTFKYLLQNRRADFHEALYLASETPAHHRKWWPWSDLDLFYDRVRFGYLGFSIAKSAKSGFLWNYCSQWPES